MKKTFKFDFQKGEFVIHNKNPVELQGIEALKMWIEKIIKTQLNHYSIYKKTSYGANIEDLIIGKSYKIDFAESELKREIENALLQNEDIESINSFSVTKKGAVLLIEFTLISSYGLITEELTYDN